MTTADRVHIHVIRRDDAQHAVHIIALQKRLPDGGNFVSQIRVDRRGSCGRSWEVQWDIRRGDIWLAFGAIGTTRREAFRRLRLHAVGELALARNVRIRRSDAILASLSSEHFALPPMDPVE